MLTRALWNAIAHARDLSDERDLRYQQRFDAQNQALEAARMSIKEGVEKAELSVNDRLTLLNELRTGVATSEQLEALDKLLSALSERVLSLEAEKLGARQLVTRVYAGIGAAVALIGVIVLFANGVF
ncbi:MAG: hypothetical protein ABWY81_06035 [Jiangellaceae bacterium]